MDMHNVIVIDDLAADRQLAVRVLRRANWNVQAVRSTVEAEVLIAAIRTEERAHTLILTDLHMPRDPAHGDVAGGATAGARWALQLRVRMEQGKVPRFPIIAFTALTEREIFTTALVFGCDAVVSKPVTPDLTARITRAVEQSEADFIDPAGATALLRLLRCRLANAVGTTSTSNQQLTEAELTRALLAYQRRGVVGLGESALAAYLVPHATSLIVRGERTYKLLLHHLHTILSLNASASLTLLKGELQHHISPSDQAAELGLSISEYYRRRREAIAVLFDLLTQR